MKSYLIIFQLAFPEINYPNMINYLKTAQKWARPAPGVWIIKTTANSNTIRNSLQAKVNPTDKIFITSIPNDDWATRNIDKRVTDWMKNNL